MSFLIQLMSFDSDNTFRASTIRPPIVTPRMIESVQFGLSHRAICSGCNSNVCVTTNQMIENVITHKVQCSNPTRCRACRIWENTITPIIHLPGIEQLKQEVECQAHRRRIARRTRNDNILRQRLGPIMRLPSERRKRLMRELVRRRREVLAARLNTRRLILDQKRKQQRPNEQIKKRKERALRLITNTVCIIRVMLLINDICNKNI